MDVHECMTIHLTVSHWQLNAAAALTMPRKKVTSYNPSTSHGSMPATTLQSRGRGLHLGLGTKNKLTSSSCGQGLASFINIIMVPEVLHACYDSDICEFHSEHGFKRLRLVCKAVREVLQRELHAYTLLLGAEDQQDHQTVVTFLKSIDLLRLKVVFSSPAETGEQ